MTNEIRRRLDQLDVLKSTAEAKWKLWEDERHGLVKHLRETMTVRQVAEIMGLSFQRVSQIEHEKD